MTKAAKIYSMRSLLHYSTSASMMRTYKLNTTSLVLDISVLPDSFAGVGLSLFSEIQRCLGTTNSLLQQTMHVAC